MELSALPAETTLLTEPGCTIANFAAIRSLLTVVWVLSRIMDGVGLRVSTFSVRRVPCFVYQESVLSQFFLNELEHKVDELFDAGGDFLFDGGEVVRFGFAVVVAVLAAGFAPPAGVEEIDQSS